MSFGLGPPRVRPVTNVIREAVQRAATTWTHPLEWADDPARCALYLVALRDTGLFFSRDEIEDFIHAAVTQGEFRGSPIQNAFEIPAERLDLTQRRNLVALTWPRPLGLRTESADELISRSPYQLYRHIQVNLAAVALRWSRCSPPEVDGVPLELGEALRTLGPREGITPALTRQLLGEDGPVIGLDEIIDIARVLRLSFGESDLDTGSVEIPNALAERPSWHVDAAGLMGDLMLERRVLAYADTLARDFSRQRPEEIHRLRIAPYGPPPSDSSRYRALFDFFDQQTRLRFVMTIDELEQAFAGGTRRKLPPTARHQRGWWSNPRPGKDGRAAGVGTQRQRTAWLTAGYEATNVQVKPNPRAAKSAERLSVISVTFRAVPGRELWHPFRHVLRAGGTDPLSQEQQFLENLASHDVTILHWYDTVLMRATGSHPWLSL